MALAHVASYACYNDGSVRDWQRHTMLLTSGKNFPGTGGLGPMLVTTDEVGFAPLLHQDLYAAEMASANNIAMLTNLIRRIRAPQLID